MSNIHSKDDDYEEEEGMTTPPAVAVAAVAPMVSAWTVAELPVVFHDVSPIAQDDGPQPVCTIAYKPDFVTAYNYMRAMQRRNETSLRALKLTALCLKFNSSNYTVWHYRRQCLLALYHGHLESDDQKQQHSSSSPPPQFDLELELAFCSQLGGMNPKNYQIWYHRRALLSPPFFPIVLTMELAQAELDYTSQVFEQDGKNYHAWSHRQWVLMTTAAAAAAAEEEKDTLADGEDAMTTTTTTRTKTWWKKELDYVETVLLKEDVRNNSAWNQRWFAVHHGRKKHHYYLTPDEVSNEVNFALNHARLDPFNESPWRYLMGILKEQLVHVYRVQQQQKQQAEEEDAKSSSSSSSSLLTLVTHAYQVATNEIQQGILVKEERDPNGCANLNSAIIDLLEMMYELGSKATTSSTTPKNEEKSSSSNNSNNNYDREEALEEALFIAEEMATKHDCIRRKYWRFRMQQMEQLRRSTE